MVQLKRLHYVISLAFIFLLAAVPPSVVHAELSPIKVSKIKTKKIKATKIKSSRISHNKIKIAPIR